jgi:hypothetical protein
MSKDDRLFAPFPIEMDEHPKIFPLSDAAFRALFEATFYSRRMLSDGFIDERVVLKRWGQEVADELSNNDPKRPSWIRVEGGWQIHDFEKHHPTRVEILEKREQKSDAGRANGIRSGEARRTKTERTANEIEPTLNEIEPTLNEIELIDRDIVIDKDKESAGDTSSAKRAHRLPNDFQLTPAMSQWAKDHTPGMDYKTATATFIDYWQSAGGVNARKVDWQKAWQVWMRKDFQHMTPGARIASVTQMPADRKVADLFCPTHPGYPLKDCTRCREVA